MRADPAFQMTIEGTFFLRDRGAVVVGCIESGMLKVGDELNLTGKTVTVAGIEAAGKVVKQGRPGDRVGILLQGVARAEIRRGDILTG